MASGARTLTVVFAGDADQLAKSSKTAVKDLGKVDKAGKDVGETFGNTASKSGQVAGAFGDLGGALSQVNGPIGTLGSGMELLGPTIMGLTGAMDLAEVATGAWEAVQWGLDAAMDAMPIIAIIAGVLLLIAGIVLLWKNSETFRDIVTGAFDAVWAAIKFVWDWVSSNWPLLLAILTGPIGIAVLAIVKNWDTIKDGFKAVYDFIVLWVGNIVSFLVGVPGKVKGALAGMWNFVSDEFKGVINTIIGWWNGLHFPEFKIPKVDLGPLGSIGGGTFGGWSLPDIPKLAAGGIVNVPTLALIGEAGPEAVVPLGAGGIGSTVNLTIQIPPTANPAETGRAVADVLRSYFRAGGRLEVPA